MLLRPLSLQWLLLVLRLPRLLQTARLRHLLRWLRLLQLTWQLLPLEQELWQARRRQSGAFCPK